MRTSWILAVPMAVLAGCAHSPPSVDVIGEAADMATLDGEWFGEYESRDSSRKGRIYFRFDRATGSAMGHVLVVSEDATGNHQAGGRPEHHQFVDLSVVRVTGPQVVGTLAPHHDLLCRCRIETTFRGTLDDGMIRGTFTSLRRGPVEVDEGEWWAGRIPASR